MSAAWSGSTRRSELPPDWERRRLRILERDGYRCTHVENGRRCIQPATDVHHIGDRHDHSDDNLASLCHPHHATETAAEAAAARAPARRLRPEGRHPALRP